MNPILELKGVSRSYGDVVAVDRVDLEVPRGVIYGVLGPNGAGKTTAIRMILKIILPDAGEILFDGAPLDRRSTDRIGYLPEERGLYKRMRVEEHIVYLARLKGMETKEAHRRTALWLERFELSDRAKSKIDELSKGMQQKIQFIGTVISEPEMVVLDEPFSGLDPINVKLLREIIEEIRRAGRTVLFSTHVMEQAEQLCDHIFLINQGRKVLDGPLEQIIEEYPVDSIRVRGEFDPAELAALSQLEEAVEHGNEWRLRLADGSTPQALLEQLVKLGRVDRFSATRPPLSEIFIREVEGSRA